ncbi:MAG: 50S ribosomal protein L10 [Alphaproteobacteria bacterium]|nr:50S ribosomal protein L10 [Alphaproteobacteria bacterium]
MDRTEKQATIDDLNKVFSTAGAVVVTHYTGLTVAEMGELRKQMRANGARFRVAKNRLAQRALDGTPYAPLKAMFKGPTGVAVSPDAVSAAKAAIGYAKKNEKLVVLGGAMGAMVLDAEGVKRVAQLPSFDELRGKIVGLLKAPATKIAAIVQAPAAKLARVVKAHAEKSGPQAG